jgi:hypothetical protein
MSTKYGVFSEIPHEAAPADPETKPNAVKPEPHGLNFKVGCQGSC